jgi:ribose transport system substrate-binding protein
MISRRNVIKTGIAIAVMSASAREANAQGRIRIGFANYNDESSFGAVVLRGVQNAAKGRPDLEVLYYDNRSDVTEAVQNARLAATTHLDAFIEYSSDSAAANPEVSRIVKVANLPTIGVQSPVPGMPLFAVDNQEAGYEAGKGVALAAKSRWPSTVPAVFLIGDPQAGPMFIDRVAAAKRGILEVFPTASPEEQSSKDDPANTTTITTSFLTENPGKKVVIFAHEDEIGVAALTAARNAGRTGDVLISSTGGEAIVLPEIRKPNGPYVGTFSFFPDFWGADLLNLASKLAQGKSIPALTRPTRQLFVNAQNIEKYFPLDGTPG